MRILMVCLGNICRSPLAHGILEHLIREKNLDWQVDSAGTSHWNVGNPPDQRSIEIAKKYGIDISNQCSRQFTMYDFDQFDRILVMDRTNLRDVLSLAKTDEDREKVTLLLGEDVVPDPYYAPGQFEAVYLMIEKACRKLIEDIVIENNSNS